jgi:dephospho-CoA kinase
VIEAIKLIEAGLHHLCQALWVTTCPAEQQIERLMRGRALSFEQAELRVSAQPPQAQKINLADVVIDTSGSMADTRRQVNANFLKGESYGGNVQSESGQTFGCGGHR